MESKTKQEVIIEVIKEFETEIKKFFKGIVEQGYNNYDWKAFIKLYFDDDSPNTTDTAYTWRCQCSPNKSRILHKRSTSSHHNIIDGIQRHFNESKNHYNLWRKSEIISLPRNENNGLCIISQINPSHEEKFKSSPGNM
jgi:hypothetical protein